MSILTICRN